MSGRYADQYCAEKLGYNYYTDYDYYSMDVYNQCYNSILSAQENYETYAAYKKSVDQTGYGPEYYNHHGGSPNYYGYDYNNYYGYDYNNYYSGYDYNNYNPYYGGYDYNNYYSGYDYNNYNDYYSYSSCPSYTSLGEYVDNYSSICADDRLAVDYALNLFAQQGWNIYDVDAMTLLLNYVMANPTEICNITTYGFDSYEQCVQAYNGTNFTTDYSSTDYYGYSSDYYGYNQYGSSTDYYGYNPYGYSSDYYGYNPYGSSTDYSSYYSSPYYYAQK